MKFSNSSPINILKREYASMCCKGHEKIGFDGKDCPLCLLREENNALQIKVEYLKDRVHSLYGKAHF